MKTIITSLIKKIERVKKEQEVAKKNLSCASAMLEVSFTEVTQAKWIECHEKVQELKNKLYRLRESLRPLLQLSDVDFDTFEPELADLTNV